jgi:hypothetical protein
VGIPPLASAGHRRHAVRHRLHRQAVHGRVRNSYKDGVNAGASGILRYYPADQLDVIVLSNSERGAWAPIEEIHRLISNADPAVGDSGIGFA